MHFKWKLKDLGVSITRPSNKEQNYLADFMEFCELPFSIELKVLRECELVLESALKNEMWNFLKNFLSRNIYIYLPSFCTT